VNELILACSLGIGVVAGLRSMTAPAVVSWAAYVGWLNVATGPFWFTASIPVVVLLTAWALFELVIDKTSKIGNRTELFGLIFRIVTSSLSGAVISSAAGIGAVMGMSAGLVGGMLGTYGGYNLRKVCVRNTSFGDLPVACVEDTVAICLGVTCVYFVGH
jgi:uncharacterized membrane protein